MSLAGPASDHGPSAAAAGALPAPLAPVWAALDPRASLRARVGWCVALPLLGLLALLSLPELTPWPWTRAPQGSAHATPGAQALAAALAGIGVLAWAAGQAAVGPLQRWAEALHVRGADDLSALAAPRMTELHPLAQGLNRLLSHQREAMDQHKRFLADASHQLRTPLAVLRTQLQSGPASDPRVPDMLRTLDRATAVADELLSRMKLEQRLASQVPSQPLRLDQIAQEAALEFSPLIAQRRLAFSLDAVPLSVPADAWMLGELVRNLLANAVRHTPHGAVLNVVVRRAAGAPELIVSDSGPGIADDVRERLFEPFAAATGGTGVGLGLSICRQLAQAMGAEVQLFNRSDGEQVVGVDAVVRWAVPPEPLTLHIQPGDKP